MFWKLGWKLRKNRIPIWTNKEGDHIYSFKDINDSYLVNIICRLERKGIPVPVPFYKELSRRGMSIGTLSIPLRVMQLAREDGDPEEFPVEIIGEED